MTVQKADVKGAALPILREHELYGSVPSASKGQRRDLKGHTRPVDSLRDRGGQGILDSDSCMFNSRSIFAITHVDEWPNVPYFFLPLYVALLCNMSLMFEIFRDLLLLY